MSVRPWVVAACVVVFAARNAGAQTLTFEKSFAAGRAVTVDVTTTRGKITVRRGNDDAVRVVGTVTVRTGFNIPMNARDLAARTAAAPPIEQSGTVIRLRPPSDPMVRAAVTVGYEIEVPARATVIAVSDSGATEVIDAAGGLSIKTGSGPVTVSGAPRSPWTITTESSAVDVTFSADASATVEAVSKSGSVKADSGLVDGPAEPRRVTGNIRGAGPSVTIGSRSGVITLHAK